VKQGPFLLGLGLVTGSTLALEVLDTRVLSIVTWYSLAFFVLAMGLCGLTAGAVRVYFLGEELTEARLPAELSKAAYQFALAIPLSYVALLILPIRSEPVATTFALFLVFSAALAMPFYPAGIAIAASLTRTRFPIGRVYAVDLAGAALGAPLMPLLLLVFDGGSAIFMVGAMAAGAALAFARAGTDAPGARRATWALVGLAALSLVNNSTDHGFRPIWVKEHPEYYSAVETELWNSHSRIEVLKAAAGPALYWGQGAKCQPPILNQRVLIIDGHAATPLYDAGKSLETLRFLECDVTDVANLLRPGGPAAIIGVGGSRDIQAAVLAGHSPVLGIELNDRMLQILHSKLGAPALVADRPDVHLVHDDARSYLSRTKDQFRVVQASLIDTWAATGAGAHALGENGLYTLEAWRTFLDRVEPGGVLTVSRWATIETSRMVALAVAALIERGVAEPRSHLALLGAGLVKTLIVGRDPLTAEDGALLRRIADERGFSIVALPDTHADDAQIESVLAATSRAELDRVTLKDDLDLRPSTDDRPFFFNVMRLRALFHPLPQTDAATIEGNLLATRTLGMTVLASLLFAVGSILWPLSRRARPKGHTSRTLFGGLAYFLLIGVGFMLIEIAILQRLSIVLGHPIYGLIVVLSSLIAAAGVGSLVSDALPLSTAPYCYVFPVVIGLLVVVFAFVWPSIAPTIIAAETPVRIAWSVGVTLLIGLPLGLAFPAGMRIMRESHSDETPWLWGLNGVGSVMASSLAILIALAGGLTVLLLCAAGCYALLVVAIVVMRSGRRA
jgi:predicted membrane-bound spermidine synthase